MKQNKKRKTNINTKKAYCLEYVLKLFSSHQLLIVMSSTCFLKQTTKNKSREPAMNTDLENIICHLHSSLSQMTP